MWRACKQTVWRADRRAVSSLHAKIMIVKCKLQDYFCCHLWSTRVHTRVFALIRLCGGGGRSPAAGRSSYTFCMTSWNQDSPCCTKVSSGTRTRKRRRIFPKALRMLALSKIAGPMQPHAGLAPSKSQALCNMLALCSNILALCR